MANKTNCVINGKPYYKINRKIGRKINDNGIFVDAYKTFYGKNKKEAVSKYDDFMKKKENGTLSNDVHFGEAISEYITNVFLKDSKYSERTKERYILAFNGNMRDANISGMLLNDIRSIDLQKFYNELSCGASTVKYTQITKNIL